MVVGTMRLLHIVTIGYLLLLPITNINGDEESTLMNKDFITGMNKFAVQLYSALADMHPDKIIVFSPLSIQMCATMALMGAKGETATELRRGLGFGSLDNDVLADMYNGFLTTYKNNSVMKIYNKIYVMVGRKGLKTFVNTVTSKFYSRASNFNFVAAAEGASIINRWIESRTKRLIKDFIPNDAFQRTTRIVLFNVIHFKAKWDVQPDNNPIVNECPVNNTKIKYNEYPVFGDFLFGTSNGSSVMLPYRYSNILRLAVLPQVSGDIHQLDNCIKTTTISDIIKQLKEESSGWLVSKCNTTVNMGLEEAFQKLGMNRIFNKKDANFRAMLKIKEPLKISRIIHRTHIISNKKGTEAAVATAIQFHARCSGKYNGTQNPLCNAPFMYTYVHKTEDGDFIPIFMGRDV